MVFAVSALGALCWGLFVSASIAGNIGPIFILILLLPRGEVVHSSALALCTPCVMYSVFHVTCYF